MAGRSETIKIVWQDTYDSPAGWLETNDEETKKPCFSKKAEGLENWRVLFSVQFYPEKNVKAQLTNPEGKHSPPEPFPYSSSSKKKGAKVRVDISAARKKNGTWRLTVYNEDGAGVQSKKTIKDSGWCSLS